MASTQKGMTQKFGNVTASTVTKLTDNGCQMIPANGPFGNKTIGPRTVIVMADPLEWDSNTTYEYLTLVLNGGNSYISKKDVPAGVPVTNEDYWVKSSDWNAQLAQIEQDIEDMMSKIRNEYAYPEDYGAVGDGVTDDSAAINEALQSGKPVMLSDKTYAVNSTLMVNVAKTNLIGSSNKTIIKAISQLSKVIEFYSDTDFYGRYTCNGVNGNFTVQGGTSLIGIQFGDNSENMAGPVFNQIFRNITVRSANTAFMVHSHVYKCLFADLCCDQDTVWSLRTANPVFTGEELSIDSGESVVFLNCSFYVGSIFTTVEFNFIGCAIHIYDETEILLNGEAVTASHFIVDAHCVFESCHFETLFDGADADKNIIFYCSNGFIDFSNCYFINSASANFHCKYVFYAVKTSLISLKSCNMSVFLTKLDPQTTVYSGNVAFNGIYCPYRNFYSGAPVLGNKKIGPAPLTSELQSFALNPKVTEPDYSFDDGHIKINSIDNYTVFGTLIPIGEHKSIYIKGGFTVSALEGGTGSADTEPTSVHCPFNMNAANSSVSFYGSTNEIIPFSTINDDLYFEDINTPGRCFQIPQDAEYLLIGCAVFTSGDQYTKIENIDIDTSNFIYQLL